MFELVSVKSLLTKEPLRKCLVNKQMEEEELNDLDRDVRIEEGSQQP